MLSPRGRQGPQTKRRGCHPLVPRQRKPAAGKPAPQAEEEIASCPPLQKRAGTVIVSPATSTISPSTRKASAVSAADSGVSCIGGTGSLGAAQGADAQLCCRPNEAAAKPRSRETPRSARLAASSAARAGTIRRYRSPPHHWHRAH